MKSSNKTGNRAKTKEEKIGGKKTGWEREAKSAPGQGGGAHNFFKTRYVLNFGLIYGKINENAGRAINSNIAKAIIAVSFSVFALIQLNNPRALLMGIPMLMSMRGLAKKKSRKGGQR